jgi:hypothetical protein
MDEGSPTQPKFILSQEDPTNGEWQNSNAMELWLDIKNPLNEPNWIKGELENHIDPSSAFLGILHIAPTEIAHGLSPSDTFQGDHATIFQKIVEEWRNCSWSAGSSPELRDGLVARLQHADGLRQLLRRTVEITSNLLAPAFNRLLDLIKDSERSHEELRGVIGLIHANTVWSALDSMFNS